MGLINGKQYIVESIECGWYRITDESEEDYLYPPQSFIVVEATPIPPEIGPAPLPEYMRQAIPA